MATYSKRTSKFEREVLRLVAELQEVGKLVHVPRVLSINGSRVTFEHRGVDLRYYTKPIDYDRLHRMLVVTLRDLFDAGYVHADLENGGAIMRNVLVDERGKYWLIDFGSMQTVEDAVEEEGLYCPEVHAMIIVRTLRDFLKR